MSTMFVPPTMLGAWSRTRPGRLSVWIRVIWAMGGVAQTVFVSIKSTMIVSLGTH